MHQTSESKKINESKQKISRAMIFVNYTKHYRLVLGLGEAIYWALARQLPFLFRCFVIVVS